MSFPSVSRSVAAFALAMLCAAGHAVAVEPGEAAPAFELPTAKGIARLADLRGRAVYLDFWASWCGPCKQSFPWMNEMHERYAASGLAIVAVNLDQNQQAAAAFLAATVPRFDIAFDLGGQTPRRYAVKAMPTSVLIGADGKVLAVHRGFSPSDREALEQQIRKALPAKAP